MNVKFTMNLCVLDAKSVEKWLKLILDTKIKLNTFIEKSNKLWGQILLDYKLKLNIKMIISKIYNNKMMSRFLNYNMIYNKRNKKLNKQLFKIKKMNKKFIT